VPSIALTTPAVATGKPPEFSSTLARDAATASDYFATVTAELDALPAPAARTDGIRVAAEARKRAAREAREQFLRRHIAEIYDELTDGCGKDLRLSDLLYDAAARWPGLVPTRERIAAERARGRQSAKEGDEIDQGLFAAHLLANPRCGLHLIHAMLRPKPSSLAGLAEFSRTGFVDLGRATLERKGGVGHVTLTNPDFLNAEDDDAVTALETAVDLVLLDDAIEVGVLRGGPVQHRKYQGRRIFNAGINLTHLYYGRISFVEFILEREFGLLNKIYRGHWRSSSWVEEFEDTDEKPFLAAVEAFAIGGGCQLLCVMDRVVAETGAYFTLPASKEGFIPGAAPLRLPRLTGIQKARQGIFFEKPFPAESDDGRMICDDVVPGGDMDAAIDRDCAQMVRAGLVGTVANRKALRVGQEPLSIYRRYMATYSRQQANCFYDSALIANLEKNWQPQNRKL
jgi:(3,5-dihydroxyphenyl)acetyl-CoA 1,2-dioxygenase